jgi:hypothetical protein
MSQEGAAPPEAPAPTCPGADMTSIVSTALHAGQAGPFNRSSTRRICSNRRPHSRQAYS